MNDPLLQKVAGLLQYYDRHSPYSSGRYGWNQLPEDTKLHYIQSAQSILREIAWDIGSSGWNGAACELYEAAENRKNKNG